VLHPGDALALAGSDYLLLNDRIINDLNKNVGVVENAFEDATCPDVGPVSEVGERIILSGASCIFIHHEHR
jgi:hypothetical protein